MLRMFSRRLGGRDAARRSGPEVFERPKGIADGLDYMTTVQVLHRIVENLDGEAAQQIAPPDRPSGGG